MAKINVFSRRSSVLYVLPNGLVVKMEYMRNREVKVRSWKVDVPESVRNVDEETVGYVRDMECLNGHEHTFRDVGDVIKVFERYHLGDIAEYLRMLNKN